MLGWERWYAERAAFGHASRTPTPSSVGVYTSREDTAALHNRVLLTLHGRFGGQLPTVGGATSDDEVAPASESQLRTLLLHAASCGLLRELEFNRRLGRLHPESARRLASAKIEAGLDGDNQRWRRQYRIDALFAVYDAVALPAAEWEGIRDKLAGVDTPAARAVSDLQADAVRDTPYGRGGGLWGRVEDVADQLLVRAVIVARGSRAGDRISEAGENLRWAASTPQRDPLPRHPTGDTRRGHGGTRISADEVAQRQRSYDAHGASHAPLHRLNRAEHVAETDILGLLEHIPGVRSLKGQ
ncbi:hypothetical protein [Plantibacter sp. YIM 135249]|uniref:hypothetical protein n=1 Tax=Plantibacter sp. YIM 135249 TaxID=3423918 RepID=UPI003D340D0E